jgi:cyclopropane-fatty-acyl-phospholipid synthase
MGGASAARRTPTRRPPGPRAGSTPPTQSSTSGRLDSIETIRQWRERFAAPSLKKTLLKLQLLPRWLTSADFRLAFTSGVSANSVCFLLDHDRLVFEKEG